MSTASHKRKATTRRRVSAEPKTKSKRSAAEPTVNQQRILDEYHLDPNAASVARTLGQSQDNVRRVVKKFEAQLRARQRDDAARRQQQAFARMETKEEWAGRNLKPALDRLTAMAQGATSEDSVALRANKMIIDLCLGSDVAAVATPESELDLLRENRQAELQEQLGSLSENEGGLAG